MKRTWIYTPSLPEALIWFNTKFSSPPKSLALIRPVFNHPKAPAKDAHREQKKTYTLISFFITARKITAPLASFISLNSPTPSRKLSALFRAEESGIMASDCLAVSSCVYGKCEHAEARPAENNVIRDLLGIGERRSMQLSFELIGCTSTHRSTERLTNKKSFRVRSDLDAWSYVRV